MSDFLSRVASAPISWGICEVPGWGEMLPTDRVLREMKEFGFNATELGAPGFLPSDGAAAKAKLAEFDMEMLGGFVPLVLHDPAQREKAIADATAAAKVFEASGGSKFVTAVILDEDWSVPRPLTDAEKAHFVEMLDVVEGICAAHGLEQVIHPHAQTLVETAADVEWLLGASTVKWTLDTGHLAIGGVDPVQFARDNVDRVGYVHLKDVNLGMAPDVLRRELSLMEGAKTGLFTVLGQGDVDIAGVVRALEDAGYRGRYVIEQDTALTDGLPPEGSGPIDEVRASMTYLTDVVAPTINS
jgi:inosose dehydratase